jgi:hypothetical protein
MDIVEYAKSELKIIGMLDSEDEMNKAMCDHLLHMCEEFAKEGHSGFSANYAINCLQKLLRWEPLSPLTGEDSEWNDVSEYSGEEQYQNRRCSRVFKDKDVAYDIRGKVFTEHYYDQDGKECTTSFTSRDSHVMIQFPYTPTTEYVDVGFGGQE